METYIKNDEFNKLRWKCRRGMKEIDLLLESFLENYYLDSDTETQIVFAELLELEDTELYSLLINKTPANSKIAQSIIAKIHQSID